MSASLSLRARSALFRALFPVWTALVSTLCLPLLLYRDARKIAPAGRLWGAGTMFLLKHVCNLRFAVRGEENIPPGAPVIFACKHQSVWETAIFLCLFPHPAYVLKKELLSVPLFGTFLRRLEMIAINRSGGSAAIKELQRLAAERLREGRAVVIFPEGTRKPVGATTDYQSGVAFLYAGAPEGTAVVPTSLNSGEYWSPFSRIVRPGVITMSYRPPIPVGLPRKEFMKALEESIERGCAF
ncbi:MAG: lysophospholipid acyltransferase family protein [Rickettsiales bacterium]